MFDGDRRDSVPPASSGIGRLCRLNHCNGAVLSQSAADRFARQGCHERPNEKMHAGLGPRHSDVEAGVEKHVQRVIKQQPGMFGPDPL
jgi:hypothetical protein